MDHLLVVEGRQVVHRVASHSNTARVPIIPPFILPVKIVGLYEHILNM